ncbi:speckle-type POZ protein-like [Planococcus citri]|uniref:speckle-type POZ protein-like n=1 Tax=Planococcus citri TaxID=170843 RepID=UPI0031F73CA8
MPFPLCHSSVCTPLCTLARKTGSTEARIDKASYIWTIHDFNFHEAEGSTLYATTFSITANRKFKWNFELKPNGETDDKDTISVYLMNCSFVKDKVYAKLNVFILDSNRNKVFAKVTKVNEFDREIDHCNLGFKEFLKKDDIFRNNLLIGNALTIMFEIEFSAVHGDAIKKTVHECIKPKLFPDLPACNLKKNLRQMLKRGEFSDVTLISNDDKEFPAHKNILMANSPVFATMFKHDMKERRLNRVEIDDMDAETVYQLLRYIYTGKCKSLKKVPADLLAAADKYGLDRLKLMCAEELGATISVDNAASILALADLYDVKELKNEAIKFISLKPARVLNSPGWKDIHSNELVNEVCSALARL